MWTLTKRNFIFLNIIAALVVGAVSCNSKTDEDETEIAVTPALVAVKNFHMQANDSVLSHLDSVFFSIDLNTGVIFNADSLPKGTNVSRLVPSITFANSMTKVDLVFFKDNDSETTTVDYLKNPTDTIDFSQDVKLEVTAQDGVSSFSYVIKVNVHKEDPDSIIWDKLASSPLPSRLANPLAQKTIMHKDMAYCLVWEKDDTFTLSSCSDLYQGIWNISSLSPGFYPDVSSFTATPEAFYLLSITGELYVSEDLTSWAPTGEDWINLLGAYGDVVLGVKREGEIALLTQYPRSEDYEEIKAPEGFPLAGSSPLGVVETKWADKNIAFLACGVKEGGYYSSNVWAYDGSKWAVINSTSLPALDSPMMVRYVVYRDTTSLFSKREFDVWLLFGGIYFDGSFNRKVYISYNNGVSWTLAPDGMQLPETFPNLGGADLIVSGYDLTADLAEAWTSEPSTKTRTSYSIDGYEITWNCPYLYFFGGYFPYPDNSLNSTVYRGVLQRLTFVPDI